MIFRLIAVIRKTLRGDLHDNVLLHGLCARFTSACTKDTVVKIHRCHHFVTNENNCKTFAVVWAEFGAEFVFCTQ